MVDDKMKDMDNSQADDATGSGWRRGGEEKFRVVSLFDDGVNVADLRE